MSVLLSLVLLYPIIEAVLFRGLIQPFLAKRFDQRWFIFSLANALTGILFVLAHFINHPPAWALAVLIPSLVFGYAQARTNNLAAPILLHCTYNAGFFLVLGSSNDCEFGGAGSRRAVKRAPFIMAQAAVLMGLAFKLLRYLA